MTADIDKVFPASDAISAFQRRIIAGVAGTLPFVYILMQREIISTSTLDHIDFSIISLFFPAIIFFIYAVGFLYETILFRIIVPGVFFSVKNAYFPDNLHKDINRVFKISLNKFIVLLIYIFIIPLLIIFPLLIIVFGAFGLDSEAIRYKSNEKIIIKDINSSRIKNIEVNSIIMSQNFSAAQAKYINDGVNSLKSNVVYASIIGQIAMGIIFFNSDSLIHLTLPWYVEEPFFIYMLYTASGLFSFYPFKSDLKALIVSLTKFAENPSRATDAP